MNRKKWVITISVIFIIICAITIAIIISKSGHKSKESSTTVTELSELTSKANTATNNQAANISSEDNSSKDKINEENLNTSDNNTQTNTLKSNTSNTSEYAGALSVNGTKLVDKNGNTVQLKGLSTHGIGWFPQYVNADFFKQLKEDFGINVIRLAMYTAEGTGYCTGGDKNNLKNLIENGVAYATQNDMYAIIDWHILSDNNPNMHIDEAKQFFNEMSEKYAQNSNVIYEICNEPNGGTSWTDIKSYAEEVIPVIRSNSPNSIIIVGTPTWSQDVDKAAADPITDYDNIMYALHFYAATHKNDLRNKMVNAIHSGLPIFVTEFGICDASGNGGIDKTQSAEWISTMNSNDVSYIMWNISNKNETSSIINSSCSKSSNLSEDDLTASGKWFLDMMNGNITYNESSDSQNVSQNNWQNSSNQNSQNQSQNNSQNNYQNMNNSVTPISIDASAAAQVANSWESDNHIYKQYNIIITNNTDTDCTSWTASIDLGNNFSISQGWCANFEVDNTVLKITPLDYNSAIQSGQKVENIGLIVIE